MVQESLLLSVEGLKTHCFTRAGVVKAVDGVSFTVNKGDALGIVGESGCGKSMTCNSIVRLVPQPAARIVAGRILFEGEDLLTKSESQMRQMRGKKISMILQDPLMSLNPVYTIGNQVAESFKLHGEGLSRSQIRRAIIKVLGQVNIPSAEQRLKDYPYQFSGGMRQRTVAAMALAGNPSLLIADEPTTALDVTIQDQFLRLLRDMQQQTQMGLIMVTHDLGIVAETCNRLLIMYAGKVVEEGGIKEVFKDPAHPYTEALLRALPTVGNRSKRLFQIKGEPPNLMELPSGCSFGPRCHRVMDICREAYPPMVSVAVEKGCLLEIEGTGGVAVEHLLSVQGLHKHFPISMGGFFRKEMKALKAVDGVSLTVEKGTSFALAGESGSGKTTLARMILLLEKPTSGLLEFEGRDVMKFKKRDNFWYRTRVQAVFQDASGSLNPRMRIGDIVGEPLEIQRAAGENTCSNKEIKEKTAEMLHLVGLAGRRMGNYPHELSGGQKQRVAIARAMILNPSMVILDEPVSALDVSIRAQILNLLADLQDKLGLSYFIIAHDLAMLGHVSTKIAVMYLGRIIEMGDTEEVYSKPLHPYTQALFAAMPLPDPTRIKETPCVRGEIGSAMNLPQGCRFNPRCGFSEPRCLEMEPILTEVGPNHSVACHMMAVTNDSAACRLVNG